jgi:hypothetical protein
MDNRTLRWRFLRALANQLRIVWPILSALLLLIMILGVLAGLREGWSVLESLYFSFITGLTIGYGDLAPKHLLGRVLAIFIGITGVVAMALLAAVAVSALQSVRDQE